MSKALKRITVSILGATLAVTLSACTDETGPGVSEVTQSGNVQPAEPVEPAEPGEEQTFDGEGVTTETITANNMEIEIPSGLRIPEDTLVTDAQPASIMMADEDPTAVTDMVSKSAKDAGYEVYAEAEGGTVYVGNGNAVLFTAGPMVQMITWGPEEMKDVLAGN